MNWDQWCQMREGEGREVEPILIRLRGGLTVSGAISVRDAKTIFREPASPALPFQGDPLNKRLTVVLPAEVIEELAFPYFPSPEDQNDTHPE